MKTINLFLKAHFTSLSPDGQFIGLAIVSDDFAYDKPVIKNDSIEEFVDHIKEKSFYCEFSDFDINRCDDWVKDNVISKLNLRYELINFWKKEDGNYSLKSNSIGIKRILIDWLSQFSDYKLNFIVDCGWFCWGKFVELIGEWETKDVRASGIADFDPFKVELPKLPANFPPVPQDLNDLIALRRGISVSEAFELDRELLGLGFIDNEVRKGINKFKEDELAAFGFKREKISDGKFNALWDAKVTKAIYEKFI